MFDMAATVVRGVAAGTSVGPLARTASRTSDGPGGPGGPGGPCTDPLKSLGVSDLSLTSAPVNDRFATFLPVTAFFAMSLRFTWPFLMSPESIRLTPGSATAVPHSAATSAMNPTTIAGDGQRVKKRRIVRAPFAV